MRTIRLLLVIAFGGAGLWGIADALLHPKPMAVDCAEYVASRPNSSTHHYRETDDEISPPRDWIELTDCEIGIAGIAWEQTRFLKDIKRVFIPVKPLEAEDDDLTRILICSTSTDDIRLAQELRDIASGKMALPSMEAVKHMNARKSQHTVKGTIGRDLGVLTGIKLERVSRSLKDGFVIINENQTPSLVPALCALAVGGLLALTFLIRFPALTSRPKIHPFPAHLEPPPPPPRR